MTSCLSAQPLFPSHALALARIAELRAAAERHHLARELPRRRRSPAWPHTVVAALRDSLSTAQTARRGAVCATC